MPSSRSRSVKQLSSRVAPIALGWVKSYSVPATADRPVGSPRSFELRTVRAGAVRTMGSTFGVPKVRYGWKPQPYGHGSGPALMAVVETDEAVVGEGVLDRETQAERVAGLRMEFVLEHDAALLALADPPARPPDESVDRVPRRELVERELLLPAVELVGAVLDPVRPGDQHLPAAGGDLALRGVGVEQLPAACRVRP